MSYGERMQDLIDIGQQIAVRQNDRLGVGLGAGGKQDDGGIFRTAPLGLQPSEFDAKQSLQFSETSDA